MKPSVPCCILCSSPGAGQHALTPWGRHPACVHPFYHHGCLLLVAVKLEQAVEGFHCCLGLAGCSKLDQAAALGRLCAGPPPVQIEVQHSAVLDEQGEQLLICYGRGHTGEEQEPPRSLRLRLLLGRRFTPSLVCAGGSWGGSPIDVFILGSRVVACLAKKTREICQGHNGRDFRCQRPPLRPRKRIVPHKNTLQSLRGRAAGLWAPRTQWLRPCVYD